MSPLPSDPALVHPRPQLVRPSWRDLCGDWQFAYDDADRGLTEEWHRHAEAFDRIIRVPCPPESKASGLGDTSFHPVVWYRTEVDPGPLPPGQRLLLHFGAVDYRATVWADGARVGEHVGGHTPFSCDLTDQARSGAPVAVVVRAEDQPGDLGQPRGKQDWQPEPHRIWYHRTTGIWQPVWLEVVPDTCVSEVQWTPDVPGARVRMELLLSRVAPSPSTVEVRLRLGDRLLAEESVPVEGRLTVSDIPVPVLRHERERHEVLWSPDSPHLVEADIRVLEGDRVVDEVSSYLGLRSVGTERGHLVLNGTSVYLRSVLAQGYWPETHLAAPDAAALQREVELIRELGFNGVRVHQKVEDPRFLYWCDRLGLLVWGEMANALTFDADTAERFVREWLEVVRRDRSHPCIVAWAPLNESWGAGDVATDAAQRAFVTGLYHLTKATDPSRPALSNEGWEHTESDIWTVHDYAARGDVLRSRYGSRKRVRDLLTSAGPADRRVVLPGASERGQPVMLTEFGGVRFDASGGTSGWGYSEVRTVEAFVERLEELVSAVVDSRALSGFCYTQLTDTEQEQNGLLTADREPKAPVPRLRAAIAGPRSPWISARTRVVVRRLRERLAR